MEQKISNLREDYRLFKLDRDDLLADPIQQFNQWFGEAMKADEIVEPNAMTLSTVSEKGLPSARIVLLKGIDQNGFVFYTNYQSKKGQDIAQNANVALTFWWPPLQRQIRIEGIAEKTHPEVSDAYFQSRPKSSQIGAIISPQSTEIESRKVLEDGLLKVNQKYGQVDHILRPDHWGGYVVKPKVIEFWQGRQSRLHDRFTYKQKEDGKWEISRLAP